MKRIVIVGATSGIGREVARIFANEGWTVGAMGRRKGLLMSLQTECDDDNVQTAYIDITNEDAPERLAKFVERLGGMDVFMLCSGIGFQNTELDTDTEMRTVATNCDGFTRMVAWAFNYFKTQTSDSNEVSAIGSDDNSGQPERGHIVVISSIAGTKGLGVAPAYSATKRFQNTYIEALSQLASMKRYPIDFTDIRPGFVATDLLRGTARYPMLMSVPPVAQAIVNAIKKRKRVKIIDWRYHLLVLFWRLIPRSVWVKLRIVKTN